MLLFSGNLNIVEPAVRVEQKEHCDGGTLGVAVGAGGTEAGRSGNGELVHRVPHLHHGGWLPPVRCLDTGGLWLCGEAALGTLHCRHSGSAVRISVPLGPGHVRGRSSGQGGLLLHLHLPGRPLHRLPRPRHPALHVPLQRRHRPLQSQGRDPQHHRPRGSHRQGQKRCHPLHALLPVVHPPGGQVQETQGQSQQQLGEAEGVRGVSDRPRRSGVDALRPPHHVRQLRPVHARSQEAGVRGVQGARRADLPHRRAAAHEYQQLPLRPPLRRQNHLTLPTDFTDFSYAELCYYGNSILRLIGTVDR